ncbi:hypothetical protein HK100_002930 [Physocladia obscura]|uniref:Homeobox domain-containing protein n=1 Tax=Physocladia obscura TaxID=109957 RepID=A0AAD5TCE0_9FUNG|nr:hypothetical protein HK100_002930 [Physocladia obscura]
MQLKKEEEAQILANAAGFSGGTRERKKLGGYLRHKFPVASSPATTPFLERVNSQPFEIAAAANAESSNMMHQHTNTNQDALVMFAESAHSPPIYPPQIGKAAKNYMNISMPGLIQEYPNSLSVQQHKNLVIMPPMVVPSQKYLQPRQILPAYLPTKEAKITKAFSTAGFLANKNSLTSTATTTVMAKIGGEVRPRIKPRKEQTDYLVAKFEQNVRPSKIERSEIAFIIGLPVNFVTLWFQNRRSKATREGPININQLMTNNESRTTVETNATHTVVVKLSDESESVFGMESRLMVQDDWEELGISSLSSSSLSSTLAMSISSFSSNKKIHEKDAEQEILDAASLLLCVAGSGKNGMNGVIGAQE